jgi:hypothetical protein
MPNSPVDIGLGAPNAQSYTVGTGSLAGTVTDNVTDLMWQQTPTTSGGVKYPTFTEAAAATFCASMTLGGFQDWRLPTAIELDSLLDYNIAHPGPVINATAFPSTPAGVFWTSTVVPGGSGAYWAADFSYGYTETFGGATPYYVRCVR